MMHCDQWIAWVVLSFLAVNCSSYTTEELNSVIIVLDMSLEEYKGNPVIEESLFDLIANYSTTNCSVPRQDCKLVPQYNRKTGQYKRNITSRDYIFDKSQINELIEPETWTLKKNASVTGTQIVFNMYTYTKYDYLKWTELVRIIYYYSSTINNKVKARANLNITNIFKQNPSSYIAQVIDQNTQIPTAIACVILGSALLLFIILVPLSNTKHCRKELADDYEEQMVTEAQPT